MPLQTVFATGKNSSGKLDQAAFVIIVLAITFGWLLVSVWQRVLENFAFGTLGLNEQSTLHSILVALVVTVIFLIFTWMIDQYNIVPSLESDILASGDTTLTAADQQLRRRLTSQLGQGTRTGQPNLINPGLR